MMPNTTPRDEILFEDDSILFNEFKKKHLEEDRVFFRSNQNTPIVLLSDDKITDEGGNIFVRMLNYQP